MKSAVHTSRFASDIDLALERATNHLLAIQAPEGYWWAELEANVTMAAEHLMLEHVLGTVDRQRWQKIARYILDHQGGDGSWPIYFGGPGDLSVTCEAYFALKLAGTSPDDPPLARAREWILAHGGVAKARVFTRIWLAMLGQFDWRAIPAMPPLTTLLPLWSPFNIYEFASWARATMVAIFVIWARRPVVPVPPGLGVEELFADPGDRHRAVFARDPRPLTWRNVFLALDNALRAFDRLPWHPLRTVGLGACERWIVEHQEADGSWGGIQPPWVYSLIALKSLGYPLDHPVMAAGLRGLLSGFGLERNDTFTIQPCVSPVWDTALAVTGLREAGVPADDPALRRAGEWLISREVRRRGDWARKVDSEPGGWPFEFANEMYPDTDDTAEVLIALRLLDLDPGPSRERAHRWLRAMQSRNGGWASFDRDNTREFVTKIPFADFGATLDPPSEDVTAHILEAFLLGGASPHDVAVKQGIDYLERKQEPDGSWWGRWGVNYIYGLGAAIPALRAAGMSSDSARMRSAAHWLVDHQNADGGWGETCASYEDPSLRGQGPSTASQTAWALLALLATEGPEDPAVERGVGYLAATQSREGGWDEPYFTGTGFPAAFMLNYHLYRNYWPLWALGRYRRLKEGRPIHRPGDDPWR